MEQRPNTAFTEREKEKRRQEIMNIQDRRKTSTKRGMTKSR